MTARFSSNRRSLLRAGISLPALALASLAFPAVSAKRLRLAATRQSLVGADNPDTAVWAYNGTVPGPELRFKQGERLSIEVENALAVDTTVHWHGVRVPIEMDGVPEISQPDVKKGESFTYDFVVRDAGLYWYHPHIQSAAQVGYGLYGALLVEDENDGVGVADQVTMVLSDIGFDKNGTLDAPDSGGSAGDVFGREGDHVLLNGRKAPTLRVRSGAPQR